LISNLVKSINFQDLQLSNFSKVSEHVYGSAIVKTNHLSSLALSLNIKLIINLISEEKPSLELLKNAQQYDIDVQCFDIVDRHACDMKLLIHLVNNLSIGQD
jgi:hypothetical protein